jgi:hypothetical protein
VPHIVVTHPLSPRDNLDLYRLLGAIFGRRAQAERLCEDRSRAIRGLRYLAAYASERGTPEHAPGCRPFRPEGGVASTMPRNTGVRGRQRSPV